MLNAFFDKYLIIILSILLLGLFSIIGHVEAAKFFAQVQYTYTISNYQRVIEFIPKSGPFKYCIFVGFEQQSLQSPGGGGLVCSHKVD